MIKHFLPLLTFLLMPALLSVSINADTLPFTALQLSKDNIHLKPTGPDAIAGLGDWLLSNGTLCIAISDLGHETGLLPFGGELIDVGHCGKSNDQWPFQHLLVNLDKDHPLHPISINAKISPDAASINIVSENRSLRLFSRYQLHQDHPQQVLATYKIQRFSEGEPVGMVGALFLHPQGVLTPFSLSTYAPQYSTGFKHPAFNRHNYLELIEAMIPADIQVLVGDNNLKNPVTYALHLEKAILIEANGQHRVLPTFQQTHSDYTIQGLLTQPLWLPNGKKLGLLAFMQSQLMDIDIGQSLLIQQRITVGKRSDVASVTNQLYHGSKLQGRVINIEDGRNAIIHINSPQGHAITSIRPEKDGRFYAKLPLSTTSITLNIITPWGTEPPINIQVKPGTTDTGNISIKPASQLILPDIGPARLIFIGLNGTANPDFSNRLTSQVSEDAPTLNTLSRTGHIHDLKKILLAPGQYLVIASRGMEYSVIKTHIKLSAGQTKTLSLARPKHELPMKEWLAADFHVHAAPSFDSSMPIDERLRSFIANGSDVLISSEHNRIVSYQKNLKRLGFEQQMHIIDGVEFTGLSRSASAPYTNGHSNIFPVNADENAFSGGLPPREGRRIRDLIHDTKKQFPSALFQLNHPRGDDEDDEDLLYFEHLLNGAAYDANQKLHHQTNASLIDPDPATGIRDLDFDLLEIANGPDYKNYKRVLKDWFSLLKAGEKITGTGNSDSHGGRQLIAIPQNYIRYSGPYSQKKFIQAIDQGRLFATTGPMLDVWASTDNGKIYHMGETLKADKLTLNIKVNSASWVPINQLNIYLNGELYKQMQVQRNDHIILNINVKKDSFIVVEVTGKADALYAQVAPGFTPFAFSNPIYIDASSDNIRP
ncbi:MAG: CehA/McbA family metallohydrolase [Pseudomonadales bacterium]|nr:CehA/McbA family metallohydrolase [Pseudomonadales bacterium]